MKAGQTNPNRSGGRGGVLIVLVRCLVACLVTGLLVFFLIASRWLEGDVEVLQLRTLEGTDPVSVPAPPPPPALTQKTPPPPPPPQPVELPRLDLSINEEAPPIQAEAIDTRIDVTMKPAEFTPATQPPKAANLYSSAHLDTQPTLINRPTVTFPETQARRGVEEGKVVLEVLINSSGKVRVRRVISSSHPDFIPMAKSFATRARFTPPKKDGRVVNALFNWPLVLRP